MKFEHALITLYFTINCHSPSIATYAPSFAIDTTTGKGDLHTRVNSMKVLPTSCHIVLDSPSSKMVQAKTSLSAYPPLMLVSDNSQGNLTGCECGYLQTRDGVELHHSARQNTGCASPHSECSRRATPHTPTSANKIAADTKML